jgi:excisionase family DNA binding protein
LLVDSQTEYSITDYLCCGDKTVRRAIAARELPAVRVGNRLKVRVCDLDAWLDARTIGKAE